MLFKFRNFLVAGALSSVALFNAIASELTSTEQRIMSSVEKQNQAYLSYLEDVVNINSGTLNLEGVKKNGEIFKSSFESLGFKTRWIDLPAGMNRAGHLVATKEFGLGPHIMLIGHLDTVFGIDSPLQTYTVKTNSAGEKIATGPGVMDMKGGNVVILAALDALIKNQALKAGKLTVFFTGDEEYTGKPMSQTREEFIEVGKSADYALNFEGGCPEQVVIGRRGFSSWKLKTTGRPAHSSKIFSDTVGAGANFELARIVDDFYEQVRGESGLTFNVSKIVGGTDVKWGEVASASGKKNVVAKEAQAEGEIRFLNQAQLKRARDKMRSIVAQNRPLTQAQIVFEDGYPAMEATAENKKLLDKLNEVQYAMGLPQAKPFPPEQRGAADISFVAPYVTSLDGLGVCGGNAHTINEWMKVDSLRTATQRAAILIYRLLNG